MHGVILRAFGADRQSCAKCRDYAGDAHADRVVPAAQRLHSVQAARGGRRVAAVARRLRSHDDVPRRHRAAVRPAVCARRSAVDGVPTLRAATRRYTTALQQNETFDIMSNDFEAMIDEDFSLGNKNENHVRSPSTPYRAVAHTWPAPGPHLARTCARTHEHGRTRLRCVTSCAS